MAAGAGAASLLLSPLRFAPFSCSCVAVFTASSLLSSSRTFGFLAVLLVLAMVDGAAMRKAGDEEAFVRFWTITFQTAKPFEPTVKSIQINLDHVAL